MERPRRQRHHHRRGQLLPHNPALRLTPDAGRLTPDAGRRTPDAGRRTPDAGRLKIIDLAYPEGCQLMEPAGASQTAGWPVTLVIWSKSRSYVGSAQPVDGLPQRHIDGVSLRFRTQQRGCLRKRVVVHIDENLRHRHHPHVYTSPRPNMSSAACPPVKPTDRKIAPATSDLGCARLPPGDVLHPEWLLLLYQPAGFSGMSLTVRLPGPP